MKAKLELNDLYQNFDIFFYFLRRIKNDVERGRCLRGIYRRLNFIEAAQTGQKFEKHTWKRS